MMNESFYRLCFQTLKTLYELKLINDEEKLMLKDLVLSNEFSIDFNNLNVEYLSFYFLQEVKKYRREIAYKSNRELLIIDEETDEESV